MASGLAVPVRAGSRIVAVLELLSRRRVSEDREVLALRHFEGLSNSEVALVLGLSKTAASNRYIRALERLKEILKSRTGLLEP